MDRTIKSFSIESEFEGVQLTGICRWVGDMMQVEMTSPMKGVTSYISRFPFRPWLLEKTIENRAEEELQALFIDLLIIMEHIEDYRKMSHAYQSYHHKLTRRNAELRKTLSELETQYADHTICKKEYSFQKELIEELLTSTDFVMFEFGKTTYQNYENLTEISPTYVSQILNWIDRNPIAAKQLVADFRAVNPEYYEMFDI